jgi:hypothetical protein
MQAVNKLVTNPNPVYSHSVPLQYSLPRETKTSDIILTRNLINILSALFSGALPNLVSTEYP